MISMPAYFSDTLKKEAALTQIMAFQFNKEGIGIFDIFGLEAGSFDKIYDLTGFPASLISVVDHILCALPGPENCKFAIETFAAIEPGLDVANIGWQVVEHVLTRSVARCGETFVDKARQTPSLFPNFNTPRHTQSELQKNAKRDIRIARKLGREIETIFDPRISALMKACSNISNIKAGEIISWAFSQDRDREQAVESARRILLQPFSASS